VALRRPEKGQWVNTIAVPVWVREAVVESRSYIDTVEVQQNPFFRKLFINFAREHCGDTYGPCLKRLGSGRTSNVISLHQPDLEAVWASDSLTPGRVTRVHVALDLITRTKADAREVHHWLAKHLVQGDCPRKPMRWFKSTTYFDRSVANRTGSCLTIYSDNPSKIDERRPCCHLEWRTGGAQTLERAELRYPEQLVELNHTAFWEKRLKLRAAPASEILGAMWMKAFLHPSRKESKRFPWKRTDSPGRVGELLLRGNVSKRDGQTYCHDLAHALDHMPGAGWSGVPLAGVPPAGLDVDAASARERAVGSSATRRVES
jgi:hypothetical protein